MNFPGAKDDRTAQLELQYGLDIHGAEMKVKGLEGSTGSGNYPKNITVDVWEDGNVNWQWVGEGYGPLGMQDRFSNDNTTQNITFKTGSKNDNYNILLPSGSTVTSAKVTFKNPTMGTGKILVLGCEYQDTYLYDVKTKLEGKPNVTQVDTYNMYNKQPPTLETLQGYDKVLVWTYYSGSSSWNKLGDALANYVDEGGGVVVMMWSFYYYEITGRWKTGSYNAITPGSYSYSPSSLVKDQPTHPILNNVNSLTSSYYTASQTTCAPGGTKLAHWANSYVAVCTKAHDGNEVIGINMWPISQAIEGYSGWSGDGGQLMYNALMYAGYQSYDISVDFNADSQMEWSQTAFGKGINLKEVSGASVVTALNTYLSTHSPTQSDDYENKFVAVPLSVTTNAPGKVMITNIQIAYEFSATIKKDKLFKPLDNYGSLKDELNEKLPTTIGTQKLKKAIKIKTESSGKVRLYDLNITFTPYSHEPDIISWLPEEDKVVMSEDTSVQFKITAKDKYPNIITYKWFVNNKVQEEYTGDTFDYYAGFDSVRQATVQVEVNNSQEPTFHQWSVTINNVNRYPEIVEMEPVETALNTEEGGSLNFAIVGFDLDHGPAPISRWYVDDVKIGSDVPTKNTPDNPYGTYGENNTYRYEWAYHPDYYSADASPLHIIKGELVDLTDGKNSVTWEVTVESRNTAPVVDTWKPQSEGFLIEENTTRVFSVLASSIDNDPVLYQWWTDNGSGRTDMPEATETSYSYTPSYSTVDEGDTSSLMVCVDAKDLEELSATHCWNVTIKDVNREPIVLVKSPESIDEGSHRRYNDLMPIRFDASESYDMDKVDQGSLSYNWYSGTDNISAKAVFDKVVGVGTHGYVLKVTDSRGAYTEKKITFIVEPAKVDILVDRPGTVSDGDSVTLKFSVINNGDTGLDNLDMTVMVDNEMLIRKNVTVKSNGTEMFSEKWKATKGTHDIKIVYFKGKPGEKSTVVDTISVQEKQLLALGETGPEVGFAMTLIVAVGIIGAVYYMTMRKKPKKAEDTKDVATAMAATPPPGSSPQPGVDDAAAVSAMAAQPAAVEEVDPTKPILLADGNFVFAQREGGYVVYDQATGSYNPVDPAYVEAQRVPEPEVADASTVATVTAKGSAAEAEEALDVARAAMDLAVAEGKDISKMESKLRVAEKYYEKQNYTKAAEYAREAMGKANDIK